MRFSCPLYVVLTCAMVSLACAHSTIHSQVDADGPAHINSFHIHVLFTPSDLQANDTVAAMQLRKDMLTAFPELQRTCTSLFADPKACSFPPEPTGAHSLKVGGDNPFVSGEWSIFFYPEDLTRYSMWVMQRRQYMGGELSVLVHPNSGTGLREQQISDHIDYPLWGGDHWHLRLCAFGNRCNNTDMP